MFKVWGIGDLTEETLGTGFTHIEAPKSSDVNNHITLQRTLNNLYELQKDNYLSLINAIKKASRTKGVFEADGFDIETVTVNTTDYLRIKPGTALTDSGDLFVNRPQPFIASRQLEKLLNLITWPSESTREYVDISYDTDADTFSAVAKIDGTENTYTGYSSGMALLEAIRVAHYSELNHSELLNITLEPTFEVPATTSYIGINTDGTFYISGTSGNYDLYTVNNLGSIVTDYREYYKPYNQFENGIDLNIKSDGVAVDADASITVNKASGGNAIISWDDTESRFDINKDVWLNTNKINNLEISNANDNTLDLSNAGLTVGSGSGTGDITIASDGSTSRALTLKDNLTINTLNDTYVLYASGANTIGSEAQLSVSRGGTNIESYTAGDILYASAPETLSKLSIGNDGDTLVLSSGVPSWGAAGSVANSLSTGNGLIGDSYDGSLGKTWSVSYYSSTPEVSTLVGGSGSSNSLSRGDHSHPTNIFHVGTSAPSDVKLLWVDTSS